MLAWRETARIQREGIARLPAGPLQIVARTCEPGAHSSSRLEQGEKHEKRLGFSPRPLRSLAPVSRFSLGYLARHRDSLERDGLESIAEKTTRRYPTSSMDRLVIFLARHVLLPALARAHSRPPLPRPLSHQNISRRQCVGKRYLIWRHCSSIYTTCSGLWFSVYTWFSLGTRRIYKEFCSLGFLRC